MSREGAIKAAEPRARRARHVTAREFVLAVRAIWRAWETGERLSFHGEFYKHTLMTPFFDPARIPMGTRRSTSPPSVRG